MIREKQTPSELVIDLTGPDGNAYHLIAQANKLATQLSLDANAIVNEMMTGDYENLIEVFDAHFGLFVVLER